MWRLALLVFGVAGCDRLFGLQHIESSNDAGDSGLDRGVVRGSYVQEWAENAGDSVSAVVRTGQYASDRLSAQVTLDDGSTRNVTIDADGFSFTTPAAGDHYSLRFHTPSYDRTFDLAAPTPQLVERSAKRIDQELAPGGTSLTLDINASNRHSEGFNTKEELVTTGTWSRHQIGATAPVSIDCATPDSSGVELDMLKPHDAAYYTSTQLVTSYYQLAWVAKVGDVATVPGVDVTLPATPLTATSINASDCARVSAHGPVDLVREGSVVGDSAITASFWFVNAAPAPDLALVDALPLAYGDDSGGQVTVMYGNPYAPLDVDVESATFVVNAAGLISSSAVIVPAAADCATTVDIPAGLLQLPATVKLAGTVLATNQQLVALPKTGRVELGWDVTSDGDADYFIVYLDQIVGASLLTTEQIVTTQHVVHIPADHFLTANTYRIRVQSILGVPNAATGDFKTTAARTGVGGIQTTTFRPQ